VNALTLVRKNLLRNKVRVGLMLLCIAIAFMIYGVLGSFLSAFELRDQVSAADRLMVTSRVSFSQTIPLAHAERVAAVPGVKALSYVRWGLGYYREPRNMLPIVMIDAETYLPLFPEIVLDPAARRSFLETRNGLIVGRGLAERFGWKVGGRVPLFVVNDARTDGSKTWDFVISGIYTARDKGGDENGLAGHYGYFNETLANGRDGISWIIVKTADPALNERVIAGIDRLFANSAAETKTQTEAALGKAFLSQLGDIALIVRLVVGAAFVIILFIVGNTMIFAINERTREIGLLKTIGFSPGRIVGIVAGEVMAVSALGGLIGLGAAALIVAAIAAAMKSVVPGFAMTGSVAGGGVLLILLLGTITGLAPSAKAYRLQVIDALNRR
jgi:putative ABC transport system permease protein